MARAARTGLAIAAVAFALAAGAGRAAAQGDPGDQPVDPYAQPAPTPTPTPTPAPPAADAEDDIDDQVAQALYQRGLVLFDRGSFSDAKTLFAESLERSPQGRAAGEALRMLRSANQKLGLSNLDDGRPGNASGDDVVDPYGGGGEGPLDPYADGGAGGAGTDEGPPRDRAEILGRRLLIGTSAAVGLVTGLAIAGPTTFDDSTGEEKVEGGAFLLGTLGGGVAGGLAWYLTRDRPLTAGQANAISSAGVWGSYNFGLLGDALTGVDSDTNDVWKFVSAGGLLGIGGGALYAARARPSVGEVSFINSLSLYGTSAGLLLGVAMAPPESEAYSLNAFFGSTAGIAGGMLLRGHVEASQRRMLLVDLGAAGGVAATWILLYPAVKDDGTNDDEQAAGFISTLTLGGGALLLWYLTRGMDADETPATAASRNPAPPALAQRAEDGSWRAGVPFLRPMTGPALAPQTTGLALGLDLVSGRF